MAEVKTQPTPNRPATLKTSALLINAGAHFPLAVNNPDVILIGGILLNRNFALIEHMREIVFPVGSLIDDVEGATSIYIDDVNVNISRQRHKGQSDTGTIAPPELVKQVLDQKHAWVGRTLLAQEMHMAGFETLLDGEGQAVGMISVAFPDAPYRQSWWQMLAMVAGLLASCMLAISVVFLRTAKGLTQRLEVMGATMSAVGQGNRMARVPANTRHDELSQLGQHFNALLDTIAAQDQRQSAAQQTIADEATRRRALFENERDGVVILNPDGSVFEANPKCAAMLGYSVDELLKLHIEEWDDHFSPGELRTILQQLDAEGLFLETLQRRKDGSVYPAEVSLSQAAWGDRSFIFVLQRDISERKAVETELAHYRTELERRVDQRTHELNERSEQLNTIFALSPDGFVSFDQQRCVTFANLAFQHMTGFDASDIMGLDEDTFSQKLASKCAANAVFEGMASLRSARKKVTRATGSNKPSTSKGQFFELSEPRNRILKVGIRLSEADSVSQILYLRDVTHETEVDRLKSEFLSTAAHELRTPMASILGYSELLLMEDFEAEHRHEFLTTIYRQSQLMASVINELLDLARIEARRGKDFKLERLALQKVVTQTLADFHPPQGRSPPLITHNGLDLFVKIDDKKMQQVVLNITSNAYKYSPQGGEVSVRVYAEQIEGVACACFDIRDQGIGMNAEQLEHVCERFYRADTSGKILGTGLGMSIVKEIIVLLQGDIELQSTPGLGTTVKVWLPLI
jgi:PAS domain S-box-containing protein